MYIAIAGNIGSGKTTITNMLAKHYGWKKFLELVQDRTIFEGVYVFATNNKNMGNMDERDYDTYMGLFDSMMKVIKMPELMVYLRASVPHLVKNIQKRGRDYEQQMPIDYLQGINNLYGAGHRGG